jgi:LysR family glycine cleavage system transcriptional activator
MGIYKSPIVSQTDIVFRVLPDPESLNCFLAAARHLSFRAAAREVSLTPPALGKRIAQLEAQLGTRLFQRTTRRVELTEAGLRLIPSAESALRAVEECVHAARGQTEPPSQDLVIGTRHELGLSWLLPMLGQLEKRHPFLTLHLYFGSGPDLELRARRGEIDCAVSSRQIEDPRIEGLPLHREDYAFVAHPKLLAKTPLDRAAQFKNHTLIDVTPGLPLFSYWRRAAPVRETPRFAQVRILGSIAACRWAILHKQGVGLLPRYQVARDLERGSLQTVLTKVEPRFDSFRLLVRRDDPRRSLFEALAIEMRAHPLK